MEAEQQLYNKLIEVLNAKLDNDPSSKDLEVVLNFLKYNNIQATLTHKGLYGLATKSNTVLPFEDEELDKELPLKRIK